MTAWLAPATEAELADAVRGTATALRITGGGTRPVGAKVDGRVLSTAGLTGITLYDPGALTLVVRAGTPLAEVQAALAGAGQRLPFEPVDHRVLLGTVGEPTIGGMVATNASGPARVQAGACRDALIGVRFVDGAGTVIANGGRVMKNVTGYDLVKLMAGSFGTLGVITEVAFKLLPEPAAAASLNLPGLPVARAVEAMAAAMGAPYGVTGAAYVAGDTLLRVEGLAASVAYRAARLCDLLARFGAAEVQTDPVRVRELWAAVRDVAVFAGRAGDVWRVSVKPSDAPGVVARVPGEVALDWAGGLIWALVPPGTDLRAMLGAFAGHATLIRADAATRARLGVFHPEPAALAALSRGLRQKFDPRGILNPGLMG